MISTNFKKKCLSLWVYFDDWEKLNETTLPEKEEYYSNLNIEEITDADNVHEKIFWNTKFRSISWFLS